MQRLNLKFLVGFFLATVLICVGAYAVWAYNVKQKIAVIRQKAVAAEEEGDLKAAVRLYQQYLNYNAGDNEQLGKVAIMAADIAADPEATPADQKKAYRLLSRSLRSMPDRNDLRRKFVDVLVDRRMFSDAQKQIIELEKQNVSNDELDFLYATCSEALGEYDQALEWTASLIGYDRDRTEFDIHLANAPQMLKAYVLFAEVLRRRGTLGRGDEILADATIEQMVVTNPKSAEAFMIRGDYLQEYNMAGTVSERRKRFKLAQESMRNALSLDKNNIDVLLANADLALTEDEYELADEYLRKAQQIAPGDSRIYISRARASRRQYDQEGVIEQLQVGLQVLPNNHEILSELFAARLDAKQNEQARAVIKKMQEAGFREESVGLAEAKLLMLEKKWPLAIQKLESLRPFMSLVSATGTTEVDSLLSKCFGVLKYFDRQLLVCSRLLSMNPRSPDGMLGRASALLELGRLSESYDAYQRLRRRIGEKEFGRNASTRDGYTRLLIARGKTDPGYLEELRQLRQGIYSAEGFEEVAKALIIARSLLMDDRNDEALESLSEELVKHSDSEQLQDLFLTILVKQKGPAAGLNYVSEALARADDPWKDRPAFLFRRAAWTRLLGGPDVLNKLMKIEEDIEKYDKADWAYLWQSMARVYYGMVPQPIDKVRRCLQHAVDLDPEDRWVVERLFELAMEENSERDMLNSLSAVADGFGKNSDLSLFLQARYQMWKYDQQAEGEVSLAGVEELISRLATIRPQWHKLLQLRGSLAAREEKIKEAIDFFKEALQLGPRDHKVAQQLVDLLLRQGRYDEAQEIVGRTVGSSSIMQRMQIITEAVSGDKQKAREALDTPEWVESEDAEKWMWRGRVLNYLDHREDAEKSFRKAMELAPEKAGAASSMIDFLIKNNRLADAYHELRDFENRMPEKGPGMQVLATYYARRQMITRIPLIAEHYIKTVIDADQESIALQNQLIAHYVANDRIGAAIGHLNAILEEKLEDDAVLDPLTIWARRSLARLLMKQIGHQPFQHALGLLEANRVDGELSHEDIRVKGLQLALRKEPAYRQLGLTFLENIPLQNLTRLEQLVLARLYFSSGRWRECRELMEKLIAQNPTKGGLLASYVEMLVEKRELLQSQRWLRKLKTSVPENDQSVPFARLEALVAELNGKKRLAASTVEDLNSQNGKPISSERILAIAHIYEELGLYREAEEQHRRASAQDSSKRLELASYLARRGNIDESIKICSEMLNKETVREITKIAFTLGRQYGGQLTPEQSEQIIGWINYARQEHPDSPEFYIYEASFLDFVGKYAEGIEVLNRISLDQCTELEKGMIANNRADLSLKLDDNEEQLFADLEKAFEILGPQVELLDTRAMALLQKGDCSAAVRDLKEATLFYPDSGRLDAFWATGMHAPGNVGNRVLLERGIYHFHLALAYQCQNEKQAARAALEAAEDLGFEESNVKPSELARYHELRSWLGY